MIKKSYLIIFLFIFISCTTSLEESLSNKLRSRINSFPLLKCNTVEVYGNKLVVEYIDSVELNDPFIDTELLFLLFEKTNDFGNIDSIKIRIIYPNLNHVNEWKNSYPIQSFSENEEFKKLHNDNEYRTLVNSILVDKESRANSCYLILTNYIYGSIKTGNSDKMHTENSFDLIYGYYNECKSGIKGEYTKYWEALLNIVQKPSPKNNNEKIVNEAINRIDNYCKNL